MFHQIQQQIIYSAADKNTRESNAKENRMNKEKTIFDFGDAKIKKTKTNNRITTGMRLKANKTTTVNHSSNLLGKAKEKFAFWVLLRPNPRVKTRTTNKRRSFWEADAENQKKNARQNFDG